MTDINENENNETRQETSDSTQDYISALNELKKNSVDRSEYMKLKADNKRLLDSIVNGQTSGIEDKKPEVNIDELRKELFSSDSNLNNLEYAKKALELRDALIEKGETDPFLPVGSQITPTHADYEASERVSEVLRECIERADGDSAIFTSELQRRMVGR